MSTSICQSGAKNEFLCLVDTDVGVIIKVESKTNNRTTPVIILYDMYFWQHFFSTSCLALIFVGTFIVIIKERKKMKLNLNLK